MDDGPTDRLACWLACLLACSPRWSLVSERVGGSRARKTHQLMSGTGFSRERVTCLGCRHVASAQRQPRERLTCSQYALSGARWCRLEQIPGGRSVPWYVHLPRGLAGSSRSRKTSEFWHGTTGLRGVVTNFIIADLHELPTTRTYIVGE